MTFIEVYGICRPCHIGVYGHPLAHQSDLTEFQHCGYYPLDGPR